MNLNYQSFTGSGHTVSYFRYLADSSPLEIDIVRFLNAIKRGQFEGNIIQIRRAENKTVKTSLKQKLQSITTAATFTNSHKLEDLKSLSGLISIDIDNLDNPELLRKLVNADKYTFCCFLSPSGNGLKVIYKIECTQQTFAHSFNAIQQYFDINFKVQIDKSCKDISRLMFISSDINLYLNTNSEIFTAKYYSVKKVSKIPPYFNFESNNKIVEVLVNKIEKNKIDITSNYADWLKIAFALVSEFGINGLSYYHRISQYFPTYSPEECEKQYNKCYRAGSKSVSIKSLYDITKQYGISFKN